MGAPTKKDWGKIHAKAWTDKKFRELLETNPKKAIDEWAKGEGKSFDKIMKLGKKPKDVHNDHLHKHESAQVPPACC